MDAENNLERGKLNKELSIAIANGESGRNQYLSMYKILKKEKRKEDALFILLRILWIDLNGNGAKMLYKEIEKYRELQKTIKVFKWDKENFSFQVDVVPFLQHEIFKLKDYYKSDMAVKISKQTFQAQICDKRKFLKIISSIINGTYSKTLLKKELYKNYLSVLRKNKILIK